MSTEGSSKVRAGSSITDELREWAGRSLYYKERRDELTAIADRIDAEHKAALEKVAAMVDEQRFDALRDGFNIGRACDYDKGFKAHFADLEARVSAIERKLNHKGGNE